MLPVSIMDPIEIDLQSKSTKSRIKTTFNGKLKLYPITGLNLKFKIINLLLKIKIPLIYPAVDFNRLLRRQQQMSNDRSSSHIQWSSNDSMTLNLNVLQNLDDVNDLLYSTIVYYAATIYNNCNDNNINHHDELNEMKLCRLKRILCMPGTRTLLLMVDKQHNVTRNDDNDDDDDIRDHHTLLEDNNGDNGNNNNDNESISDDQNMFDLSAATNLNENQQTTNDLIINELSSSTSMTTSVNNDLNRCNLMMKIMKIYFKNQQLKQNGIDKSIDSMFSSSKNFDQLSYENGRCHTDHREHLNLNSKFLMNFENFLISKLNHDKNDDLEQHIYGAITYCKSYRLESLKILEILLISVKHGYERLGIGSQLVQCLKECNRIGPYDSMRIQIPANNKQLRKFFLKNEFTDDIILNACFDQLTIPSSDDNDDDRSDDDYDDRSKSLYSNVKPKRIRGDYQQQMISMCYLPPYSNDNDTFSMVDNQSNLEHLDHHFVDEMIDRTQSIWRYNLLQSYRTQWSCIERLRSEIRRLRKQIQKRNTIIDQMRRENFHLRNSLVHKSKGNIATTNNFNLKLLYRNGTFNKLDF